MFKFKTKQQPSPQQIIAEIHNAFDTAQDRLLNQAYKILESIQIADTTSEDEVAERLKVLGFHNTQTVKKANSRAQERAEKHKVKEITRAEAELIDYYRQSYQF